MSVRYRHLRERRPLLVGEPSPPTVGPGEPSLRTQIPEPISDRSPTRMLRFEASEFPIESLSENILWVDKVPVGHHLILAHPIGSTEPGWVMMVLQTCARSRPRNRVGRLSPMVVFVSDADRQHWDNRYAERGMAPVSENGSLPLPVFAHVERLFPTEGHALELACGRGQGAVWLTSRGMDYWGVDLSPVGIDLARELTSLSGVADRCRFDLASILTERSGRQQ